MAAKKKKTKVVKKKPVKRAAVKAKKPVRKAAARKAVAKKIAVKKPVRKAVAKPAKKAVKKAAGKAAAKKSVAGKTAARKSAPAIKIIAGLPGQLYEAAMKVLHDRQAEEIASFDLAGRSSMADYLIIASGRAARQIAAIADYLRAAFVELGARRVRVEGLPQANWVLVDAGDIVVHLFRPEVRRYYRLEDIWSGGGK